MVVIFHCGAQVLRVGHPFNESEWLASGVDIFFVISGFIMWVSTANRPKIRPVDFWKRRVRRIVPLYWLVTSFTVAVLVLTPSVVKTGSFELWHVVTSFLFVPSTHPVTGLMQPVVIPGWSLNFEMFFYFIFGGCLFLPLHIRLAALVAVLGSLVMTGLVLNPQNPTAAFYTSPLVAEFALGAVLGWRVVKGGQVNRYAAVLMLVLGALLLPMPSAIKYINTITASILIVAGVVFLDMLGLVRFQRLPHLLGDASYSIYITHAMIVSAFGQLWQRLGLFEMPFAVPLYVGCAFSVAIFSGVIVYRLIELPILGSRAKVSPSEVK